MKICQLLLFILIYSSNLRAQDTLVTVKTGSNIKDVLPTNDLLLYPEFIAGKVFFRDGTKTIAMMNYNHLYDEILFIDAKGDTLALDEENTTKFISLDKDTFYFNDGYLKLIASNSVVKLAEKQVWKLVDIRKIGSHNRPATTFAVASYGGVFDRFGRSHNLLLNEDQVFRKKATFYFGDKYNHFTLADRKNLLSLFPKKHYDIERYLKTNNVKFDKEEDLEKLVLFLGQNN